MSKFGNRRKKARIASIAKIICIESKDDKLTEKCKFNFAYFVDSQDAGQKFKEWTHDQLVKLLDKKLVEYSKKPLSYWRTQRQSTGRNSHNVLEIYGKVPSHSEFTHPKHVPHDVEWARFRLEGRVRLIGFVLPSKYHNDIHPRTGCRYDCNTFYVVFLDRNHKFYLTK